MEELIQEIVAIDHKCAQAVKDAEKKKQDGSLNMGDKKKEIYESFVAQYQKTLDEKKAELRAQIEAQKKSDEEEYNASSQKLSDLYAQHKDEWVKEIVERCKAS